MPNINHCAKKLPLSGRILLVGNPNVGKSTLFNLITKSKVHTGNWSGKTVSVSTGYGVHNNKKYFFSDLPGISSLISPDAEEKEAFKAILDSDYDCCVVVADSTNLIRTLPLLLRILEMTSRCILCLNLYDEAQKKNIKIDTEALSFILGIPVVTTSAQKRKGIALLFDECEKVCLGDFSPVVFTPLYSERTEDYLASFSYDRKGALSKLYHMSSSDAEEAKKDISAYLNNLSRKIYKVTVSHSSPCAVSKIDKIVCSPLFGIPVMIALLCLVLYITITFSNYPSELLSRIFKKGEGVLLDFLLCLSLPEFASNLIVYGIYATTTTVVSVMLPPMVIFFPFFTILEDSGFLPRIAFNLDNTFKKCGGCGKQALCICMGLGCNCVGISSSAIIPSKKEKLIAILTNSFTPCNGRFGAIIVTVTIFFSSKPVSCAFFTCIVLVFSFIAAFSASFLLSKILRKEKTSSFILELPPYRKPDFSKIIISSLFEKALSILLRAAAVSAPLGGVIYLLNHFSLLLPISEILNPIASLMGLDGIILLSFILSFPANEIVLPIALMLYTKSPFMVDAGISSLSAILTSNGWNFATAVSFLIFTLMHWPCFPAVLMIKKETGSIKWTAASIILPLSFGIILCIASNFIFSLLSV